MASKALIGIAYRFGTLGAKAGSIAHKTSPYSVARFATVAENTVHLQFVDAEGNRANLAGLVGQSLFEVAVQHKVDIVGPCRGGGEPTEVRRSADWVETTFGEGPTCYLCHVQIPKQFHHVIPNTTSADAMAGLKQTWDEEFNDTSRLSCQITLTKEMEGMVVYVPDVPPIDVI